MKIAGRIAREVLDEAVKFVKPGVTTDDIDRIVHEETVKRNAYPSPLNYNGFSFVNNILNRECFIKNINKKFLIS